MQVVWFKRDLRIHDHSPLSAAAAAGPVLALYVHEPSLLAQPEMDARHAGFLREALDDLTRSLRTLGLSLLQLRGDMPAVLDALHRATPVSALWSHEETGTLASFARDRAVADWCRAQGVPWHESPNGGVVRRLRDRDRWSDLWLSRMTPAPLPPPPGCVRVPRLPGWRLRAAGSPAPPPPGWESGRSAA